MKRFQPILFLFLSALISPAFAQYDGYGLTGTYYTNPNLTSAAATQNDPWLSFLWDGCPPESNMSTSIFSAQWTGEVIPSYSEPYTFTVYVAGGVSVIVNGQALISQWTDANHSGAQGSITLTAGVPVPLQVDYFTSGAVTNTDHLQLFWQSASQPAETIPRNYLLTGLPLTPTPTPATEAACGASSPIAVNAALGEWEWTAGWTSVNRTVLGQTSGATASFKVLWDSNNLYLGVSVIDNPLTSGASVIFDNSAVELYVDTTDSKGATIGPNDFQYFFAYNATVPVESATITAGVSMATAKTPTGYVVEASIPWSTLGVPNPGAGTTLGLDVGVDVNHNGGPCRDGQLIWNGGADDYANASGYGQLTLGAACPTPVSTPPAPGGNPYVSPNPSNGSSVQFVYTMAASGTANIKVWNAWGNLVATISDAKGEGLQSSVLNVTSFAPGHYFYRVELDYGQGKADVFKTQVLAVKK